MAIITELPQFVLRSPDANWSHALWEQLPNDGNRYEVIDGVLYTTTAPSNFHQWIVRQIVFVLADQLDRKDLGLTLWSPIGLFMPGCDPVQPDILFVRKDDLGIFREKHIYGVPALLVEVLSPTNPDSDLVVKRGAYARATRWCARCPTKAWGTTRRCSTSRPTPSSFRPRCRCAPPWPGSSRARPTQPSSTLKRT